MKGKVYVYTGDGKGKTTAALGVSIRATGSGLKVFIAQFLKADNYSEIKALKRLSDLITIKQFGTGRFINGKPLSNDIKAAANGLKKVKNIMSSGEYNLVILDEANVAIKYGLFSAQDLINTIDAKTKDLEVIITGRGAAPKIIERADEVIEFKAIKHYYQKGVKARVGIEK